MYLRATLAGCQLHYCFTPPHVAAVRCACSAYLALCPWWSVDGTCCFYLASAYLLTHTHPDARAGKLSRMCDLRGRNTPREQVVFCPPRPSLPLPAITYVLCRMFFAVHETSQ